VTEESGNGEQPRVDWDGAAAGWGKHADDVLRHGMPVSAWMIDHAGLHPGQRVLELAAGPGDTGFLAAELIEPGGTLISSDSSEEMLAVARERAQAKGIENVEFRRLDFEWIDLETASVDAALCRWGYMLAADPEAALRETRRVLRPGSQLALAVWDREEENPWATFVSDALRALHLAEPPPSGGPGRFALADRGQLEELLGAAGFVEITTGAIDVPRVHDSVRAFLEESADISPMFRKVYERLDPDERERLNAKVAELAAPFTEDDGSLRVPGRSLVAAASG
jgi:SAM-dependent methyltransferase